jgi:aspartate aminotransferase-like enzyme
MGDSAREINVFALLSALETILSKSGYEVAYGSSLAAAQRALATFTE